MWGMAMLVSNTVVFCGAISMTRFGNYRLAKAAAILAVIPGLGPCLILGIPFGIAALTALRHECVREKFPSPSCSSQE
jgi:hypothetical protein